MTPEKLTDGEKAILLLIANLFQTRNERFSLTPTMIHEAVEQDVDAAELVRRLSAGPVLIDCGDPELR